MDVGESFLKGQRVLETEKGCEWVSLNGIFLGVCKTYFIATYPMVTKLILNRNINFKSI